MPASAKGVGRWPLGGVAAGGRPILRIGVEWLAETCDRNSPAHCRFRPTRSTSAGAAYAFARAMPPNLTDATGYAGVPKALMSHRGAVAGERFRDAGPACSYAALRWDGP